MFASEKDMMQRCLTDLLLYTFYHWSNFLSVQHGIIARRLGIHITISRYRTSARAFLANSMVWTTSTSNIFPYKTCDIFTEERSPYFLFFSAPHLSEVIIPWFDAKSLVRRIPFISREVYQSSSIYHIPSFVMQISRHFRIFFFSKGHSIVVNEMTAFRSTSTLLPPK